MAAGLSMGLVNRGWPLCDKGKEIQVPRPFGVGVQLYTLRDLMAKDVVTTLQGVAAAGFTEVELAGHYGHSPSVLRRMLDSEGLAAPATHSLLDALNQDFEAVLDAAMVLGNRYIVLPYLFDHQRNSIDDYKRLAERMNHWGELCKKAGICFAYHNHDFEFMPLEVPYDIILQQTDPQTVFLELDLYWAVKAGQDPLALFEHNPGRFPLWHLKDMAADGSIADVGDGVIDFQRIFRAARQAGLQHGFIEHDNTANPLATIHRGLVAVNHIMPQWHREDSIHHE